MTKGTVALKVLDDELGLLMKEAKVVSGGLFALSFFFFLQTDVLGDNSGFFVL